MNKIADILNWDAERLPTKIEGVSLLEKYSLTIIMPAYNEEKTVCRLDSVGASGTPRLGRYCPIMRSL